MCVLANGVAGQWLKTAERADFGVETTRTAESILKHGEFRDPFAPIATGPTAHVAPAYPVLYSAVLAIFGTGKAAWWAIRFLTLAAYALGLALLPLLAVELGLSRRIGVIGALLGCIVPIPGSCYKWEAIFTGLMLVAMACATARLRRLKALSNAAALGAVCGLALLFSPVVALVYAAWTVLIWRSLTFKATLVLAGIPLLIIFPWLVRNYEVFGTFIFIRDNLGTDLAESNNDCASGWTLDNINSDCFAREHPNANLGLAQRIVAIGEYRFNAERLQVARSWITSHPWQFVNLSARRFLFFWFPAAATVHGLALFGAIIVSLITAASIPGLVLMYRANRLAATMLAGGCLFYPLANYMINIDFRYRFPILWVSCIATAYLLTEIGRKGRPVRLQE